MSIETLLTDLIAAVKENTVALGGTIAATPAASTTKADKPAKTEKATKTEKAAAPKHTKEDITVVLQKVAAAFGNDDAKAIIKDVGKAGKIAEIDAVNYDAVFAAAEAKLDSAGGTEDEDDGL
jgi:hypothetical protein